MSNKPAVLHLAKGLELPIAAVTDTFAFLSRRGAGKTYSAGVLAEEMLANGAQIVVVDPVAKWWALRLDADGKSPGFEIPVFGGTRGDIPLHARAGTVVADVVVDRGISVVLDVSEFTLSEQRQFVTDFSTQLFTRRKRAPSPMHVFLEEAQEFIPQNVQHDQARMVGAIQRLIKLGRNFGIGVTLISQRAASVNKDALTQTEVLVALQTTGPQDRKAIRDWIDHTGAEISKEVVDSLPTLKTGHCYLWSPGRGLSTEVKFRKKQTFDASKTPEVGDKRVEPKALAPVELAAIESAMAEAVVIEKANDPRELRAEITKLRAELQRVQKQSAAVTTEVKEIVVERIVEVPVLDEATQARLEAQAVALRELAASIEAKLDNAGLERAKTREFAALPQADRPHLRPNAPAPKKSTSPYVPVDWTKMPPMARPARDTKRDAKPSNGAHASTIDAKLPAGARRMLAVLASRHPMPLTRQQVATLAGIALRTSTWREYLGQLRRKALITIAGDHLALTDDGLTAAGAPGAVLTVATHGELVAQWRARFPAGARKMFDVLIDAYPQLLTRAELSEQSGVDLRTSTWREYLGQLRRNGVIKVDGDSVSASEELFS